MLPFSPKIPSAPVPPPVEKQTEPPDLPQTSDTEELCPVARGGAHHLAACSLVLSAMGIEHLSTETALLVPPEEVERATRHLQAYREENRNWPPPPFYLQARKQTAQPPTLLLIGGLFLFYQVTGGWEPGNPWFQAGAIDSSRILDHGEWWRLFTGLSLHADGVHLLGNCIIGGFMVHLLCRTIGSGTGWLLLLLAGASGNLLNIALRNTPHHSVGFSTAVFAAIGMFTGLQMKRKFSPIRIVPPLGAGLSLLAFLGTEGEQTDLGAHLLGFFCGILAGLLVTITGLAEAADKHPLQRIFLAGALLLMFTCWWLAAGSSEVPLF